jgi:GAF domain-containing protein
VLADVFDSMRGLYEQPTFTHAIDFALRVAQKAVPTRLALGFRATDPSRPPEVACVARQGRTERVQLGQVFDSRGSLLEWAWHHNRPVAVDGDGAGQTLSADIDCPLGAETNSVLCVPADHDGRTFGLLMLVNREPAGRWYHGDRNILCYIAGRLGQFAAESLPDPTDQDDESISKH